MEHLATASAPMSLKLLLQTTRAYAFPASLVPMLLGAVTAWRVQGSLSWLLLPLVLLAGLLLHAAVNLLNDRDDFLRGVDREGTRGGSGLLVSGRFTPAAIGRAGWLCLAAAALLGGAFVILRGWPLLLVGTLGVLGGWGYTAHGRGYKYIALGDPLVGILMGPLMVLGAHLALGAPWAALPLWASIPVALLVMAILAGNNLRDIEDDAAAGIRTLATVVGTRGALVWYLALLFGAYLGLAALCIGRLIPWSAAGALLTLPLALRLARLAVGSVRRGEPASVEVPVPTAQLHLLFGGLMVVGMILSGIR